MDNDQMLQKLTPVQTKVDNRVFRLYTFIRETVAITFWFYVIIKLFIFDIDNYLIITFSEESDWIIKYKLVIFLGAVMLIWAFSKNAKMLLWFAYISFYPFIFFLWHIPLAIYKSGDWNLAIAYINSLLSFFRTIKFNFIVFSLLIISTILIVSNTNEHFLTLGSIITLPILLGIIFLNRFILVFRPSIIYVIHSRIVSYALKHIKKQFCMDEDLRDLPVQNMTDLQSKHWASNLQVMILASKCCYFLSIKFQDYQKSRYDIIFNSISLILLFLLTVCCFALINYGVYQIYPDTFDLSSMNSDFFTFFYYSVNIIHFNTVSEIIATSNLSRAIAIIEQAFALLLGGILLTLVLSVKNEREASDIDRTVKKIKEHGDEIAINIEQEYNLSVEDAMVELERLKSSLINIIFYLSKTISSKN